MSRVVSVSAYIAHMEAWLRHSRANHPASGDCLGACLGGLCHALHRIKGISRWRVLLTMSDQRTASGIMKVHIVTIHSAR